MLMIASLIARRSRQRGLGMALSTTGLTLTTISAWLGGEMVYRKGTGVSRIAFEPRIEDFQVVARADALESGKLTSAEATVDGHKVALTLLKRGRSILAISGTCPHWGGPLAEGKLLEGDVVECPWHASRFRMHDGCAVQGPASMPVNVFETRVRNGNVEVRSQRA